MSSLAANISALARVGGRVLRIPTAILVWWAAAVLVVSGLLVWAILAPGTTTVLGTVVLIAIPVLLAVPVALFAVRRSRWLARTAEEPAATVVTPGQELLTPDAAADVVEEQMRSVPGGADVKIVLDAFTESQLPPTSTRGAGARLTRALGTGRMAAVGRSLGHVERAQRALLTAAGGPVQAPYLKDDLRITLAALAGSLLAIAAGIVLNLVLIVVLIAR